MNIIKRSGEEVEYESDKIINAVSKANSEAPQELRLSDLKIRVIEDEVHKKLKCISHTPSIEEIQDLVINEIQKMQAFKVATLYTEYRYKHELARHANTTDAKILSLIDCANEEVKQENSNKNPTIVSVQRDYMAGETSRDITERLLLPEDVVKAHKAGIIHFHDSDYYSQRMHNCCLVNLEDMLQNGTVISETMIEKPHSFATACNVATQIIAQIASSQYGGQSITLSHLAPFVDVSRQKQRKVIKQELTDADIDATTEKINELAEMRVRDEIRRGIQTIQYQVITLMTTNGQAPFVTIFMYIDEVPEGQTRDDLAVMIEEMLNQRIKGVKNEKGVYITPAFPKLIYVLEEDNIHEGSKYWELTKLAARCTAKRMVPDYISEKVMKEQKNGDCYPCMGCRSFLTPDTTGLGEDGKHKYYGRLTIKLGCLKTM